MADEYIDIIDTMGNPTGEVCLKSKAHQLGLRHASVHIWLYTKPDRVLLQKRAGCKDTFPNLWDISVAGHIGNGETPKEAAVREVYEELGLEIAVESLYCIQKQWAKKQPAPHIIDHELHHIYIAEFRGSHEQLSLQEEEVSAVRTTSLLSLAQDINNRTTYTQYVPHGIDYYSMVIEAILKEIS